MSYSLGKIATKADCDMVIAYVQKEKSNLEFQKNNLQHHEDGFDEGVGVETQLTAVTAELTALDGILLTLPAGKVKDAYDKKKAAVTLRYHVLTGRKANYGVAAQVETEFEAALVEVQLTETVSLLSQLATVKAGLFA